MRQLLSANSNGLTAARETDATYRQFINAHRTPTPAEQCHRKRVTMIWTYSNSFHNTKVSCQALRQADEKRMRIDNIVNISLLLITRNRYT